MKSFYKTKVGFCDVDFNNKILLPSLFSHMLMACDEHVHINKISPDMLRSSYNAAWVLMRMNIAMDVMPAYWGEIIIETWMENVSSRFVTRYFRIYSLCQGELAQIGKASSVWTIINLRTRKICTDVFNDREIWDKVLDDEKIELTSLPIRPCYTAIQNTIIRKVMYSDLDKNKHLNSGRYIAMMMDALPLLTSYPPIYFSIKYSKEVALNEELTVTAMNSHGSVIYEIKDKAGDTVSQAIISATNNGNLI